MPLGFVFFAIGHHLVVVNHCCDSRAEDRVGEPASSQALVSPGETPSDVKAALRRGESLGATAIIATNGEGRVVRWSRLALSLNRKADDVRPLHVALRWADPAAVAAIPQAIGSPRPTRAPCRCRGHRAAALPAANYPIAPRSRSTSRRLLQERNFPKPLVGRSSRLGGALVSQGTSAGRNARCPYVATKALVDAARSCTVTDRASKRRASWPSNACCKPLVIRSCDHVKIGLTRVLLPA